VVARGHGGLPAGPDDLPPEVFYALPGGLPGEVDDDWRDYRSPSAASRALLDALARALPPC
jgi:hypothetical protein